MAEKTRYSDAELQEFKEIILAKLDKAYKDYEQLKNEVTNSDGNDTADTSPTFKVLEEGANTLNKEESGRLAQRQMKFIQHLKAALVRIENKTYGICRETGKLIPKERLKAVPHATLSIEGSFGRRIFSFSPVGQSGNIRPEKRRRNRNPGRMRRRRRRRRDYMQAKRRIRAGGVRSVFQKREIRKGDDRLRAEYA